MALSKETMAKLNGGKSTKELSAASRSNYRYRWNLFVSWCLRNERESLPCSWETLVEYLTHLYESGQARATLKAAKCGIVHYHQEERPLEPNPAKHPQAQEWIEKAYSKAKPEKRGQAAPLTKERAETVYSWLDAQMMDATTYLNWHRMYRQKVAVMLMRASVRRSAWQRRRHPSCAGPGPAQAAL